MPNDQNPARRGFSRHSAAWYAESVPLRDGVEEQVTFGLYGQQGGTDGEMQMRWIRMGAKLHPRLESFSDSWRVLGTFADVVAWMADHDHPTPDDFCQALLEMGFLDLTAKEPPERMRSAQYREALAEGARARGNPEHLGRCPYRVGTDGFDGWRAGYRGGRVDG